MATLNKIIKDIETYCTSHKQINTFYAGQTWNFGAKHSNIYPAVVLVPSPSTISDGKIIYYFNLYCIDRMNKDRSNLNEILSDTSLIIADIIAEFDDNFSTYGYMLEDTDLNIEPLEEEMDDIVAGWVCNNFSLQIPYGRNDCNAPK